MILKIKNKQQELKALLAEMKEDKEALKRKLGICRAPPCDCTDDGWKSDAMPFPWLTYARENTSCD